MVRMPRPVGTKYYPDIHRSQQSRDMEEFKKSKGADEITQKAMQDQAGKHSQESE
jgi:hypothetical protein